MNEVIQKIERIRSVFLETQLFCADNNDLSVLTAYLDNTPAEFRSIAYESASMAIALNDLAHDGELKNWLHFVNGPAKIHQAQVYVGLGWAIAKLELPFLPVVEKIETAYYFRVADGCGYYDGSFRRRKTVLGQQLPAYLPEATLPMYDQGLGRSLWYSCLADMEKVKNTVEGFPAERQAAMWRGLGIAIAYVGGCDDTGLETIWQHAGANRIQLAYGAALAARSRMHAKTMTSDTDHCSRFWFSHAKACIHELKTGPAEVPGTDNHSEYVNWIMQMEDWLAGSNRGH